jgi:hypothetical protein
MVDEAHTAIPRQLSRRLQEAECHVERGEQSVAHQRAVIETLDRGGRDARALRCSSGDLRAPRPNTLLNGVDCSRTWPPTPSRAQKWGACDNKMRDSSDVQGPGAVLGAFSV